MAVLILKYQYLADVIVLNAKKYSILSIDPKIFFSFSRNYNCIILFFKKRSDMTFIYSCKLL